VNAPGAAQPFGDTMTTRQKWLLLGSLMVSMFIGALDQTVVSTATPRILADLGGFDLLSWLFTSYMLTSTIVIPLVGKLGDMFGRKLFLIGGIALFMVASALCGAATSMEQLIVFRAIQGLGGGMIFASVFASLGDIFSPMERGKYIGLFTGTFSLASICGPSFGGFLTDTLSWRWVFYINIPVGLIAIPAIWFNLPSRAAHANPKIDFLGAAWLSAASIAALLALVWAGDRYAWRSTEIIGLFVAAAAFVALFIWQEFRHPEPVLPLHLFKNRVFLMSNLIVFTFGAGVFGAFQFLGIYMQTAMDTSATVSGFITTPQSIGVLAASTAGGFVISHTGRYRYQTIAGAALIAVALAWLTTLQPDTPLLLLSANMVVLGVGFGLVLPTMSLVVQNAVPYQYLGVASSSSQFFRQIGSVLGIAVFGAILSNSYNAKFDEEFSAADQQAVGPVVADEFHDPTFRLNEHEYALAAAQVTSLEGGSEILARATQAQDDAMTFALRRIHIAAVACALLCLLFTILMKEVPLRRTVGTPAQPAPAPGSAGTETQSPGETVPAHGPAGGH
jgi:EmrB/QacA subfamily drug resistance transporter